ncbi:hypothetical protein BYT27DRAFT_7196060 [Phlegmacium glaucopus]|nr:hypothetical protein BYT27DRAFT_7196060 [Phlegmacium glaucopus]
MTNTKGLTITPATYRHSTHLIPSPGTNGKPFKRHEPFMLKLGVAIGVPLLMLVLGVALEIAIFISNLTDGFKVPRSNIFNVFGNVTPQFLASFFPTLVVLPVAIAWRELDWNLRMYQPYLVLNKGNARAEESLLLDYVGLGLPLGIFRALNYKHRVIFWSSLTATLTYIYQPLAGSIFQIQQRPQTSDIFVTSTKSIGLSTHISDLNAFSAAAGYVDSSVLLGLLDPPFVRDGWSTAVFEIPTNRYLNGSMTVDTSGIQTNVNCSNPSEPPILTSLGATSYNLSSKSIDGCVHSVSFDFTGATEQYGVENVTCPGNASALNSSLRPVMFWFFHIRDDNEAPQAKTIFCAPTIQAFDIQVVVNLNNGSLIDVSSTGDFLPLNNVTGAGGALNGSAFNGLIFDNIANPLILARAVATRSIVPGAIFLNAQQLPNGPQSTFDLANGFLDLTTKLYTRHLAISAQSIYFLNTNTTLPATVVSLLPRLKIASAPAHVLAALLILTGFIGIFLHVINRNKRKRLLLATPPGSIASIISLTSRSGFGELLLPYDDELTMEKKLDGLRFRLDKTTGAILADEVETDRTQRMLSDDPTISLLGTPSTLRQSMSSSDLAFAIAVGKIPSPQEWNQYKQV